MLTKPGFVGGDLFVFGSERRRANYHREMSFPSGLIIERP